MQARRCASYMLLLQHDVEENQKIEIYAREVNPVQHIAEIVSLDARPPHGQCWRLVRSIQERAMKTCGLCLMMALVACGDLRAEPIELKEFVALERPSPTVVLPYGAVASQAIDVFVPPGRGPHPVAILIHGGCWRDLPGAGREQLRHVAAELAGRGIAVWSVGYRRADEAGGGYPGTFLDVATAIDRLRTEADSYALDLRRAVIVGHSAGGHLALWAAARHGLRKEAALRGPQPFTPAAVISLAGVPDLQAFARFVPVLCGSGIMERLTGGSTDAYAEISPAQMPASRVPTLLVSGVLDRLVPPYVAADFARATRGRENARLEVLHIDDAGHFDLVSPGTAAWSIIRTRIEEALGLAARTAGAHPAR